MKGKYFEMKTIVEMIKKMNQFSNIIVYNYRDTI